MFVLFAMFLSGGAAMFATVLVSVLAENPSARATCPRLSRRCVTPRA
jgi:hypothetical protein